MTRQARTQKDYPDVVGEAFKAGAGKCPSCLGDGRVSGGTDNQSPWPVWEALPPGSDAAVKLGFVYPITCPTCGGTGVAS